jgi:hypothetical protein
MNSDMGPVARFSPDQNQQQQHQDHEEDEGRRQELPELPFSGSSAFLLATREPF